MDAEMCPECDQPMLPAGVEKRPHEYDHASGCPRADLDQRTLRVLYDALREEFSQDTPDFDRSPVFTMGFKSGLDRAIDVLVRINGGAPAAARRPSQASVDVGSYVEVLYGHWIGKRGFVTSRVPGAHAFEVLIGTEPRCYSASELKIVRPGDVSDARSSCVDAQKAALQKQGLSPEEAERRLDGLICGWFLPFDFVCGKPAGHDPRGGHGDAIPRGPGAMRGPKPGECNHAPTCATWPEHNASVRK